uniref:Uncharacterized protein n=1 Tax=Plectus sambesii TaxID=2011161 RepID=A0A914W107_9BILA
MGLITLTFGLLPLKVLRILATREHDTSKKPSRWPSLIMTLLSCFAGGVFMGVCFLDLLPGANDSLDKLAAHNGWSLSYPFVELLACIGFLLVFLIEELVVKFFPEMFHVHNLDESDHQRSRRPTFKDQPLSTISTSDQMSIDFSVDVAEPERCVEDNESVVIRMHRRPHAHSHAIRSVTFMLALGFHATLEGFAFGFQDNNLSATSLFFGLIVHKSIVAFSVGMQLSRTHAKRRLLVILLVIMFASMSPIGGAVGIAIEVCIHSASQP